MSQPISTPPGITNQTTTTTGPGSPAQQAYANQQSSIARQNMANQMATGGKKYKSKGGAIALAPMQAGTSPSQVALNAKVQQSGSQSASNGQFDCAANNTCATTGATKGGRRRSRTRKTRTNKRKTRRNHKKSKRRRTKGSRK